MASNGVSPLTGYGMNFPLTHQSTFGGPLTHFNNMTHITTNYSANAATNQTVSADAAPQHGQKSGSSQQKQQQNLLLPQSLTLPHAASLITSAPVPCGVIVATATLGSLTIVTSPFGPKQTLIFRQGQCSQSTVPLPPDTPTCITLFNLPSSSSSSLSAPATFQNGNTNTNSNEESSSSSSSLAFSLCCAVGTSSGNIYIFQVSSRSGLATDVIVSPTPICVSERTLREQVDGTFSPATHRSNEAIVDLAGAYSNGIQMSILAIATASTTAGVIFVHLTKSDDGREILLNHVQGTASCSGLDSSNNTSCRRVVSIRPIQNSRMNNIVNDNSADSYTDDNTSVAVFRRSSILTFAVCFDDRMIQMVDLRLFVTSANASRPEVSPVFYQILPSRDTSRAASIVTADVYVSNERDVTTYSIEEGGAVVLNHVVGSSSSQQSNNNNNQQQQQNQQQNNQQQNNNNNNTSTNQMGQQQSSVFGTAGPTSSSVFNNNNAGGEQSSNNGGSRLNVPSLNTLSCLTSTQAVAISRNSLLLVSASNGNLRGARFNTQNLMTLPFVINDVCVLKANSAFTGERVSKMLAGSSDAVQNYAPTGMTVVFVAADRNLSLVYVPL